MIIIERLLARPVGLTYSFGNALEGRRGPFLIFINVSITIKESRPWEKAIFLYNGLSATAGHQVEQEWNNIGLLQT